MRSSGMILAAVCTVFLMACNEQNTVKVSEQVSLSAGTQTEESIVVLNTIGEAIPEIKSAYKRTDKVYYADDEKTVEYIYLYDEHGNAAVIKVFNGRDVLKYTEYRQFDENGNVTESKTVHADDSQVPVFLICYEYDESGNMISKECLNIDHTDTVTQSELETYVYSNDKIISMEHYIDGKLSTHTDYAYDYYE